MGVVLYNPSLEELIKIEDYAYSQLFDQIYIYDNSPERIDYSFNSPICQYKFQNENRGLAKPYNEMILIAEDEGYDYLCIMDQDSSFIIDEIRKLQDAINLYSDTSTIAAFCPTILKKGFEDFAHQSVWKEVAWSINSGTFLNIKCLSIDKLKYDEKIFLDGLDYDFCMTARNKGCSIMQYSGSILVQSFGYQIKEKQSFTYHSAFRYYLIAHNRKYIYKKHFGKILGLCYAQVKNIVLSFRILFNEEDKLNKFLSCCKGIIR